MATTFDPHKNFAISNITGGTAISGTSTGTVTVTPSTGGRFPASGNYVLATAGSVPDPSTSEIVRGTFSGDTLTITARAQESTTARTFSAGDIIYAGPTAKSLTDIETAVNTLENAGPGGTSYQIIPFSVYGLLTVFTGDFRIYNDSPVNKSILSVRGSAGVAPTGSAIYVDVLNSGSTIFTSSSACVIPSGSVTSGSVTGFNSGSLVAPGQYLTISVKQTGSTYAGADLLAQVTWS
jgi:archaellum component FlaF (FlaF/FlaG flagellin family)